MTHDEFVDDFHAEVMAFIKALEDRTKHATELLDMYAQEYEEASAEYAAML